MSIQFMMARDRELPAPLGLLNSWGMPVVPLVLATLFPVAILAVVADVEQLADLYAIGVVGAVSINLGSCSTNPQVEMSRFERFGMGTIAVVMIGIWITIAIEKTHALIFAVSVLGLGLTARYLFRNRDYVRQWILEEFSAARFFRPTAPPQPAIPSAAAEPEVAMAAAPAQPRGRMLLTTRGNVPLFRYALEQAKRENVELFVVFVRHLAVPALGTPTTPDYEADLASKKFFEIVERETASAGVKVHCEYIVARDVARAIVDLAKGLAVNTLILAAPRRGALWRAVKGSVTRRVKRQLPNNIQLIVRAEPETARGSHAV